MEEENKIKLYSLEIKDQDPSKTISKPQNIKKNNIYIYTQILQ